MSTATRVPETYDRSGDDPAETLSSTGRMQLLKSGFNRFRDADGTSHARSLAFVTSLVLVQGLVVVIGLTLAFGSSGIASTIVETIRSAVPGPASDVLADAVKQAARVGHHNRYLPLTIGLFGVLFTATTAMGQIERAFNRIYGIERDRPTLQKYWLAFRLALSVGAGLALAFLMLGFGRSIGRSWGENARLAWEIVRWPLGLALVAVCLAALMKYAVNRHQPSRSWLAFGAGTAVVLWALATIGLALAFRVSSTFGQTYGPLAGIVALQIWTVLSSLAILYGIAVAAELEAIRARSGVSRAAATIEAYPPPPTLQVKPR